MSSLVLYEDDHLLVVNKPSGINTHKPDPYAPAGLHEWLKKREPRWTQLSILHRLDKDTSGVLVFGKTKIANQSLTEQFTAHKVEKSYLLLSASRPTRMKFCAKSPNAWTDFEFLQPHGEFFLIKAHPFTGKTHQIRRHALENGFPVAGDVEYEGAPASRLMLHAHRLAFIHPATGVRVNFEASVPRAFDDPRGLVAATEFREPLFDADTTAYRLINGEADGFDEVIVDSYDNVLLVQWQTEKAAEQAQDLFEQLRSVCDPRAIFHQLVTRQHREAPECAWRDPARFKDGQQRSPIRENGVNYLVGFGEGLATGIFLDQRENRRRLLTMDLRGKSVLNCFAYTCAFSVAAAKAGASVTSVDLSKNYLDWGRENFQANNLDPERHDFIFGDVFQWLKRFATRGQSWDIVLLDPPTFSTTKKGRVFRAERDYLDLEKLAMPLVKPGGTLFCSTNQRTLGAEKFEATLRDAAVQCDRQVVSMEFETLPFDFRVARQERAYLKTLWAALE